MIRFNCDYSEGAHEKIMEQLLATNMEQTEGYGLDPHCENARKLIKKACNDDTLDVHFLVGGTQTNLIVIAAALRPHQGVLGAESAHVNVHETGAIESCGHKVLTLPSDDGKITADQVETYYNDHYSTDGREHIVQPKMVYISQPTELGTLYTKAELTAISEVCRKHNLILFVDGARLGYGLTAKGNDVTMEDLAALSDVFYIGGTKVGALFGEAVVIRSEALKEDFRYIIKQKGAMLAKGRLLGIQFETLFTDDLYTKISAHANEMADLLRDAFTKAGFDYLVPNTTNQLFPILPDRALAKLESKYSFAYQERVDATHSAVRFCTSWATKEEDVKTLIADIENL
ncbi:low-specificity L-threonine aldolase [Lachnospiraceae bacterium KM106-2]|nr:low-specificity L-threonine aldolase [Lachnospiraceae bacterium KM106-2]